jgi:hypothetical protein
MNHHNPNSLGTAKTPSAPSYFEPPRRQGRQDFLNRQDVKIAKKKRCEPPRRQDRQGYLLKDRFGFSIRHSWRPWRLGGSNSICTLYAGVYP